MRYYPRMCLHFIAKSMITTWEGKKAVSKFVPLKIAQPSYLDKEQHPLNISYEMMPQSIQGEGTQQELGKSRELIRK